MADDSWSKRTKVDGAEGADVNEVRVEGEDQIAYADADAILEDELRNAQAELDKEDEQMLEQMRQVERQFVKRKAPLYQARGEVIKRIPGFWLHCFMQHEELRVVLGAIDQGILSKLTELEVEPFDDVNSGYKLVLHFSENEYFEDKTLTKEIGFRQETGQPLQCRVSGCEPKWKGEDLTKPETINSGRKRGRNSITFFRWFTQAAEFPPGLIDTLADIIKNQLWVNPLEFMDADEDAEEPIVLEGDDPDEEEVWDLDETEEGGGTSQDDGEEAELEEYEESQEGDAQGELEAGDEEDAGSEQPQGFEESSDAPGQPESVLAPITTDPLKLV